jgi:hypothetical protein
LRDRFFVKKLLTAKQAQPVNMFLSPMALKVLTKRRRRGRSREARRLVVAKARDTFYAGEVTRILKLKDVDYVQLRRLFNLVRGNELSDDTLTNEAGTSRRWRRFTFRDMHALRVAARIVLGAPDDATRRARISKLKIACDHLRERCGLADPLLEARFTAEGGEVFVQLRGKYFDASTRQQVFVEVADAVRRHEMRVGVRKAAIVRSNSQVDATAPYLVSALKVERRRR